MMDIKAAVCWDKGSELKVTSLMLHELKESEVLVKITACAVSAADLLQINGEDPHTSFPMIPGHEAVGEVVEIGSQVRSLQSGDTVIPLVVPQCNRCDACLSDKSNLCQAIQDTQNQGLMPDGTSRISFQDKAVNTNLGVSGFSNYIVVPEISLAKIQSGLPASELAVLCGSMVSGLGAVFNQADLLGGENIAVFGAGPVGLGVVQAARMRHANNIIVIEPSATKRELAEQFGATHTIDPSEVGEHMVLTIQELSRGGVDFAFECSGNELAIQSAVASTQKGWGKTLLLGSSTGLELDLSLITSGRQVQGCIYGGIQGRSEMADYVRLYQEGHILVKPLITQTTTLHEVNVCLAMASDPSTVRSVIEFQ